MGIPYSICVPHPGEKVSFSHRSWSPVACWFAMTDLVLKDRDCTKCFHIISLRRNSIECSSPVMMQHVGDCTNRTVTMLFCSMLPVPLKGMYCRIHRHWHYGVPHVPST